MIDCIAVGDSIAVGTGQAMHCTVRAHVGWPSGKIITLSNGVKAELCIISAGSNDPKNPKLVVNLKKIRNNVNCKKVVWIKPVNSTAANAVYSAKNATDSIVSFTPSKDNVHPKSYKALVNSIKIVLAF